MDSKEPTEFLNKITRQLKAAEQDIDVDVQHQLRQARQQAIAQLNTRPRFIRRPVVLATSMAALIAVVVGLQVIQPASVIPLQQAEDLSLLSASEDLEFYEDLDFYQWLAFEERSS